MRAEGLGRLLLRLGEVPSDDLSGLRRDPVGEVDGELHDEVTALGRVLGERQALAPEPLHHPWLDDVVAGEGDDAVLQCGNAHGAATQSLEERRKRLAAEGPKLRRPGEAPGSWRSSRGTWRGSRNLERLQGPLSCKHEGY